MMKPEVNRVKLYLSALQHIGVDASPLDQAPDEYGCADSFSKVLLKTFPNVIKGSLSTTQLFEQLSLSKDFVRVTAFKFGDVIISPTGYAKKPGKVTVGHVGIVGEDQIIMSNNSSNGLWDTHHTISSWVKRYREGGNFPIYFFRKL